MSTPTPVFATGSVTATGTACQLGVEGSALPVGVAVGGTFVGTVQIEVTFDPPSQTSPAPVWVAFTTALTAPGVAKVDIPVRAVRVRCSAFTSGTITAGIGQLRGTV